MSMNDVKSLSLSILTAFLTFLLSIGTAILYLLMLMCVFVAIEKKLSSFFVQILKKGGR